MSEFEEQLRKKLSDRDINSLDPVHEDLTSKASSGIFNFVENNTLVLPLGTGILVMSILLSIQPDFVRGTQNSPLGTNYSNVATWGIAATVLVLLIPFVLNRFNK